ncbi:hypothetical protein GCM10022247_05490 [Allokutzneria multivorans]|uniref:Uncharacterized protein n=1 Tax=Allokutzneria multivorans TaxID=1142134 RepID=A0ABP7QZQ8_9PSEU
MRAIPVRRRSTTSRPAHQVYANPITCGYDGQEHHVTATAFHKGQLAARYVALCGHLVEPVPMAAPSGPARDEQMSSDPPVDANEPTKPVIDSQASASRALFALLMSNVDAGNDAANDERIALMDQRRYRTLN